MDLDTALAAHSEWKVKLRAAINKKESLDVKSISADNQCALGKWLQGEGKAKYGALPAFSACVTAHTAFHKAAGQVAQCISAKKFEDASNMLENGTPYVSASSAVGLAITKLKRDAQL